MSDNCIGIIILIDESGSMDNISNQIKQSVNNFINNQKIVLANLNVKMTLICFNTVRKIIYKNINLSQVTEFKNFYPDDMTSLYDSIGFTIQEVILENYSKVIFCVVTDGLENCSNRFTQREIYNMIQECKENNWNFIYLSTNIDNFQKDTLTFQGNSMGIDGDSGTHNEYISYDDIDHLSQKLSQACTLYCTSVL